MEDVAEKYFLYGEDDVEDQELLAEIIKQVDPAFKLICVNDGVSVLEFLDALKIGMNFPCLIILDMKMPKLNGIQTLKILKEEKLYKEIPVLIFSTADLKKDYDLAFHYGAVACIKKPVSIEQLKNITKKFADYCVSVPVKQK